MSPVPGEPAWQQHQAQRYLEARYGNDVWFRAPETFDNYVERWIWAVASDAPDLGAETMKAIEEHYAAARRVTS